jgi:hypothetical protein
VALLDELVDNGLCQVEWRQCLRDKQDDPIKEETEQQQHNNMMLRCAELALKDKISETASKETSKSLCVHDRIVVLANRSTCKDIIM